MNLSNYTIKAQETIQKAQQLAFNNGNPNLETNHLLKVLLADTDSSVGFLLKRNNVNISFVESKMDEAIAKLPKVSEGTEAAQNISRDLGNVMLQANKVLKEFNDEFISQEHLLLGLLQVNDDASKTLKAAGLTEKGLITAIKERVILSRLKHRKLK